MEEKDQGNVPKEEDRRTVFVRGLSHAVGDEQLSEAFSAIGPVKHAFLVKRKGNEKHKGFGFVQFALEEDAQRAAQELHGTKLQGRTIKVESAHKRASFEERKKLRKTSENVEGEDADVGEDLGEKKSDGADIRQVHGGSKQDAMKKHELVRTLALGGLNANDVDGAVDLAKTNGNVEEVIYPAPPDFIRQYKLEQDGCSGEVVLVRYSTTKDMMTAIAMLHGKDVKLSKGKKSPSVMLWARQVSGEGRYLKRWRVVVRNLPFDIKDSDVREAFGGAGVIWEVTIPRTATGNSKGFAFVGFTCKSHTEKAISLVNGTKISGRTVAVDWAMSKKDYNAAHAPANDIAQEQPSQSLEEIDAQKTVLVRTAACLINEQ